MFDQDAVREPSVVIYTSATCPYCQMAERLLLAKGIQNIEKIRVDLQPELREAMQQKTGRRTVPQIYINHQHVGGFDDLSRLDRAGELDVLLGKQN